MKKTFYGLAAIVANFFLLSAARAVTISMNIPGTSPNASTTPGAFVANFYQFALMIGGVLAFGVVVYGGVRYMASAGNPSGQSDAKEWIEAALLGLLLLVGAYFILNVVNPQLTNLGLPALAPATTSNTPTNNGSSQGNCGADICTGTNSGATAPTGTQFQGQGQCSACGGSCDGDCAANAVCSLTNGSLPWYCKVFTQ